MNTYTNEIGQIGFLNMDGVRIPFAINPGPIVACKTCKLSRFGVDMSGESCRYCTTPKSLDECSCAIEYGQDYRENGLASVYVCDSCDARQRAIDDVESKEGTQA